jgi:hypothetical protein
MKLARSRQHYSISEKAEQKYVKHITFYAVV